MPGNRAPSGTRTSAKLSSAVLEARSESLLRTVRLSKPAVPRSTRKALTLSSAIAHTIATSASAPFVIHILPPFNSQSPPRRSARARIWPGSEPPCASVSAKQPSFRPAASGGSHCARCSALPNAAMQPITRLLCTETQLRKLLSPASSS